MPPDAELTARHEEIPAWDDMPDELKPVLARQMEVYAGFLEHTDHHIGRLVDALEDLGVLEDTLVYYIIGDNGASAEGTINGNVQRDVRVQRRRRARDAGVHGIRGSTSSAPRRPTTTSAVGWAHAMDTPYQWTKQVASHWGGTRNGTIVHWPSGFTARGEVRSQFHHVIDVAPTVLEAAGLPASDHRRRRRAAPDRGHQHALLVRRCDRGRSPRDAVLRDVLQPRHLPPGLDRGHPALDPVADGAASAAVRGRRLGALRHEATGVRPTTSQPRCRRSWPSCSSSGSRRPASTTCSRSTTGASSASTPSSSAGRSS